MQKAGFTTTKSEFVNAPVINELPLTLECELVKVIDGNKYLAEIKNVSADAEVTISFKSMNEVFLQSPLYNIRNCPFSKKRSRFSL